MLVILPIAIMTHLFVGDINVSISDYFSSLFDFDSTNTEELIAREFRIPRTVMAIISGAGLSVAGLLMQNLFNNPLAGPNVLGISTGSSLFVAFSIMSGIPFLSSDLGLITSAIIGAVIFALLILFFSFFARSSVSLLLIGIMLGSFSGAFVSVLQSFSDAQELKVFTLWAMGSLQQVTFEQLLLISGLFILSIGSSFFLVRGLNASVLGEEQAQFLGINYKKHRIFVIVATVVITGLITAYCGPIAFVGLTIPNLVKIIYRTQQHKHLLIASLLLGAIFMLSCDIIIQLLDQYVHLPINALTSLVGAPFVVAIIIKRMA